jgi:transcriptional regulator with XRE-family HTH domain
MDWKGLREVAGLTLEELSKRTGYGISTINGLEKRGEGSARLKERLLEILNPQIETAKPVDDLREIPPGFSVQSEWRHRALYAEGEVKRLRAALAAMVNSTPLSGVEAKAVASAPAALHAALAPERKPGVDAPSADKRAPGGGAGKGSK